MQPLKSFEELLTRPIDPNFFGQFVRQILKDFSRAGIEIELSESHSPKTVKDTIQSQVAEMLTNEPDKLVRLFYLVDIPEHYLHDSLLNDVVLPSESITFYILKREWQKVMFRNNYS